MLHSNVAGSIPKMAVGAIRKRHKEWLDRWITCKEFKPLEKVIFQDTQQLATMATSRNGIS